MLKGLIVAALTLPLVSVATAQTADTPNYTDIDEIDVVGSDGGKIGEVETVLVDDAGMPVAMVVEVDDGFLDLGDSDVIMQLDALTWQDGQYTTTMTSNEISGLPQWDD